MELVAEVSGNHARSLDKSKRLIAAAKEAGADSVKFQIYSPNSMVPASSSSQFLVMRGKWAGRNLHEIYTEGALPYEWISSLVKAGVDNEIEVFASVFDEEGVRAAHDGGIGRAKFASNEITHWRLMEYAAGYFPNFIVSTGSASIGLIRETSSFLRGLSLESLTFLHCVSEYPAKPENYNLASLKTLASAVNSHVGVSDHTQSSEVAVNSKLLGAIMLEKHFTMDKNDGALDSFFSADIKDFRKIRQDLNRVDQLMGEDLFRSKSRDVPEDFFFRRLFASRNLEIGQTLRPEDVAIYRGRDGMLANELESIVGRKLTNTKPAHEPLLQDDLT